MCCLSVVCLSLCVFVHLSVYFHNNNVHPNVTIKLNSSSDRGNTECVVCLSVCLSISVCVCLPVCLFPQQPHPAQCQNQVEFIQ